MIASKKAQARKNTQIFVIKLFVIKYVIHIHMFVIKTYVTQQSGKELMLYMVGSAAMECNLEQLFCMAEHGFDGQSHTGHYRHSSHSMAHISLQPLQLPILYL